MAKYLVTPAGVFEEYKDDLFEGTIKAEFPISMNKEYDSMEVSDRELEEKLSVKFNRMPVRLFQEVLCFLEWCYKEKKSEGFVAHRYIDGKWENVVFPQWNASGSVCYHPELLIEKSTRVMGDTHSHPPSYGSQHSHTDGLDERKNNGIFIVVKGFTLMDCSPEIIGCVRGKRFHLRAETLFDIKDYNPSPSFPEEWKERVGVTPCKGCEKRREDARKIDEVTKKKEAFDYEKRFRLVPKSALEIWRTEVAKEKETLGKKVKLIFDEYKKIIPSGYWPRVLRCDNHGCLKYTSSPKCDECHKTIAQEAILNSIIDMADELDAFKSNPEELKLILSVLEEDASKPSETPPPASATPSSTVPSSSTPSSTSIPVSSGAAKAPTNHAFVVATEKPCGNDCVYKDYPHQHADSKETMMKAWERLIKGDKGEKKKCSSSSGSCLYPEKDLCMASCAWEETFNSTKALSNSPVTAFSVLPSCKLSSCKEGGHHYLTCDIGKALEDAKKCCPGKGCEAAGHSWYGCELNKLRRRLVEAGELVGACSDPACQTAGHTFMNCMVRLSKAATFGKDACYSEICSKGNHYMESCPIYQQRKAASSSTPAPHSYPDPIVVGDTDTCHDKCDMKGKAHRHEKSKAPAATPSEMSSEDYGAFGI